MVIFYAFASSRMVEVSPVLNNLSISRIAEIYAVRPEVIKRQRFKTE